MAAPLGGVASSNESVRPSDTAGGSIIQDDEVKATLGFWRRSIAARVAIAKLRYEALGDNWEQVVALGDEHRAFKATVAYFRGQFE